MATPKLTAMSGRGEIKLCISPLTGLFKIFLHSSINITPLGGWKAGLIVELKLTGIFKEID